MVCSFLRLSERYRFLLCKCVCVYMCVAGFVSLLHQQEKQKVQDGVMKIREGDRLWANSSERCPRRQLTKCVHVFTEMAFSAARWRDRWKDRQEVMGEWVMVMERVPTLLYYIATFSLHPLHPSCLLQALFQAIPLNSFICQCPSSGEVSPSYREHSGCMKAKSWFILLLLLYWFISWFCGEEGAAGNA